MTWDPEALTERCNHMMGETNSRNPLDFPWGLFSWADAPPAIGGGVGAFQWFQSLDELLEFVTDFSAAGFASFDEEEEWLGLRDKLRQIAAGFANNPHAAITAFNAELISLLQLDWIGRLEDLQSGDGPFPLTLRARFRDDWDDTPAAPSQEPIKEDERSSFLLFLSNYGL
jgi:hypothetical protein